MMKRHLLPATPLAAMLLLTGCMDDNYDLSNIDTTTEVKVNGLVVPVNVKDVTLNSVIDLESDSDIKKEVDPVTGKTIYVYSTDGPVDSKAIEIDPFTVASTNPDKAEIDVNIVTPPASVVKREAAEKLLYKISEKESDINYDVTGVDEAVIAITHLTSPAIKFVVTMKFPANVARDAEKITVKNLNIEFPKGLVMAEGYPNLGSYNPNTGIVTIAEADAVNGVLKLEVVSTNLEVNKPVVNGAFNYVSNITVKDGGDLEITPKTGATIAANFKITTEYDLASFTVSAFSGNVKKPIEDLTINPIKLEDFPDFLTEPGTDLKLANPQLYLEVNNPVSQYNMTAHTGLSITPRRGTVDSEAITLDGGLTIYDDQPAGSMYKYALSPAGTSLTPIAGYENAHKQEYAMLGDILSGDGLPSELNVSFDEPVVEGTQVENFPLDHKVDGINGKYMFYAPLALAAGTQIYKSGTEADWSSKDLDRLYVKEVELTATVTSEVPVGVTLSARILNTAGEHVGLAEPAYVPAMAQNYPITLKVVAKDGDEINNIDGIYYQAICAVNENDPAAGEAISPDQNIQLNDVRAKVTGRYLYEDDNK